MLNYSKTPVNLFLEVSIHIDLLFHSACFNLSGTGNRF